MVLCFHATRVHSPQNLHLAVVAPALAVCVHGTPEEDNFAIFILLLAPSNQTDFVANYIIDDLGTLKIRIFVAGITKSKRF